MSLVVIGKENEVAGTLTDGDIRRALIDILNTNTCLQEAMNVYFSFLSETEPQAVSAFHHLKEHGGKLLPVLSENKELVDIINLINKKSQLPLDAVLMVGGKGVRLRPLTETPFYNVTDLMNDAVTAGKTVIRYPLTGYRPTSKAMRNTTRQMSW